MNSIIVGCETMFNVTRRSFGLSAYVFSLLVLIAVSVSPVYSAELPSDDEQDVLIRTSLVTFNDANMTGNYSVFLAKASKELQAQFTTEKLFNAFQSFREKELFFEEVITDDYDSYEEAKFDSDGALVLVGVIKGDTMRVKYRLRYVRNGAAWKILGINVDATKR